MKRVLFSGLIMVSSLQLAAQSWAPVGASWTYKETSVSSSDSNLFIMSVAADTLVLGRNCQRLQVDAGYTVCYPFYDLVHFDGDSLWILNRQDSTFMLLHVYNAVPGQTWSAEITHPVGGYSDTISWEVLDTGSIVLNGVSLRTLDATTTSATGYLAPNCWPHCTLIERLGSFRYLFDFPIGFCDAEGIGDLRCYSDSTITWQNPDVPQCALGTSVPELNAQGFRVAPTLLERGEALTVDLGDRLDAEGLTVRLTDLSGRMVREALIAGTRTTLQVDASGAFLVVLLKNGRPIGRQRVVVR